MSNNLRFGLIAVTGTSAHPSETTSPAGTIICRGDGTAKEKIQTLESAEVVVAGSPGDVAGKINRLV